MYVYMYMYMYIRVFINTRTHTHTHTHKLISVEDYQLTPQHNRPASSKIDRIVEYAHIINLYMYDRIHINI